MGGWVYGCMRECIEKQANGKAEWNRPTNREYNSGMGVLFLCVEVKRVGTIRRV
jgi:hypothetical protein